MPIIIPEHYKKSSVSNEKVINMLEWDNTFFVWMAIFAHFKLSTTFALTVCSGKQPFSFVITNGLKRKKMKLKFEKINIFLGH